MFIKLYILLLYQTKTNNLKNTVMTYTKKYQFTENKVKYFIVLDSEGFDVIGQYLTSKQATQAIKDLLNNKLKF